MEVVEKQELASSSDSKTAFARVRRAIEGSWRGLLATRIALAIKPQVAEWRETYRGKIDPDGREFLPAAIEILETPPSPTSRITAMTLSALAFAFLLWASIGEVDIVAVAPGKLVTKSRTQVIQTAETASVAEILIEPGQHVLKGQLLIKLDSTAVEAELQRAQADLVQAQLDAARLRAFLNDENFEMPDRLAQSARIAFEHSRAQLEAQRAEFRSRLSSIDSDLANKRAELTTADVNLRKTNEVRPLIEERAEIKIKASKLEYSSRLSGLEARQQVIEIRAEQILQQEKIKSAQAAIAALESQRQQVESDYRKNAFKELSLALTQINASSEGVTKASRRMDLYALRAPLDGSIAQLSVHTIGAVVTPAQQLMMIVPENSPFEVEAVLPNQEAGFVAPGQPVEVKVDAYPFTRFGLIQGEVQYMARDSQAIMSGSDAAYGSQNKADQNASIESSERLLYAIRIKIDTDGFLIDGKPADLIPGMSVRAEIKTGKRSIIDYVLSPLREIVHQSIHER